MCLSFGHSIGVYPQFYALFVTHKPIRILEWKLSTFSDSCILITALTGCDVYNIAIPALYFPALTGQANVSRPLAHPSRYRQYRPSFVAKPTLITKQYLCQQICHPHHLLYK